MFDTGTVKEMSHDPHTGMQVHYLLLSISTNIRVVNYTSDTRPTHGNAGAFSNIRYACSYRQSLTQLCIGLARYIHIDTYRYLHIYIHAYLFIGLTLHIYTYCL